MAAMRRPTPHPPMRATQQLPRGEPAAAAATAEQATPREPMAATAAQAAAAVTPARQQMVLPHLVMPRPRPPRLAEQAATAVALERQARAERPGTEVRAEVAVMPRPTPVLRRRRQATPRRQRPQRAEMAALAGTRAGREDQAALPMQRPLLSRLMVRRTPRLARPAELGALETLALKQELAVASFLTTPCRQLRPASSRSRNRRPAARVAPAPGPYRRGSAAMRLQR